MTETLYPTIYIVGPTASGKSELALRLAKKLGGVIISADSMQIYRGLDIGTAKASVSAQKEAPHKLLDIVEPDMEFSVAEYAKLAAREIETARRECKYPIVAGGTGLYIEALLYPMSFAGTDKNAAIRSYLADFYEKNGAEALHAMLGYFDPESAERLHVNDVKRVIRALEINLCTRRPMGDGADARVSPPNVIMVGLDTARDKLYERINARVDDMFAAGLVKEALSIGNFDLQSMQAIGYKEFKELKFDCIDGKMQPNEESLREVKEEIKKHTRNYAKRQLTWFRRYKFAVWFDIDELDKAVEYVETRIKQLESDAKQ